MLVSESGWCPPQAAVCSITEATPPIAIITAPATATATSRVNSGPVPTFDSAISATGTCQDDKNDSDSKQGWPGSFHVPGLGEDTGDTTAKQNQAEDSHRKESDEHANF